MVMRYLTAGAALYLFFCLQACGPFSEKTPGDTRPKVADQHPLALENGKIISAPEGKKLYGGDRPGWHFDVTNSLLPDSSWYYGIGREKFQALLQPLFVPEAEVGPRYQDSSRMVLVRIGGEVKAYGLDLLAHHEVINDVVGGEPVLVAYCNLADLAGVYHRRFGDETLTFGGSGYTARSAAVAGGLMAFVLWDRETESLWWPLESKRVAGKLAGKGMTLLPDSLWQQTTWGQVREQYPELAVLKPWQSQNPPESWDTLTDQQAQQVLSLPNHADEPPIPWGRHSHTD